MRTGQRRYPVMTWRRLCAAQEARALRLLVAAHGRIPACAPCRWEW